MHRFHTSAASIDCVICCDACCSQSIYKYVYTQLLLPLNCNCGGLSIILREALVRWCHFWHSSISSMCPLADHAITKQQQQKTRPLNFIDQPFFVLCHILCCPAISYLSGVALHLSIHIDKVSLFPNLTPLNTECTQSVATPRIKSSVWWGNSNQQNGFICEILSCFLHHLEIYRCLKQFGQMKSACADATKENNISTAVEPHTESSVI